MEHSCQLCGTAVEDGRPFCPQCRAPQIHVEVAIPEPAAVAGLHTVPGELSAEVPQSPEDGQFDRPGAMNRAVAARAALNAGVLGFFIGMLIPFVAIVVAGAMAVFFYRRQSGLVLPPALGARIGAAAGVVAVGIQSVFFTIWIFVFHRQQDYVDSVSRFVHAVGADASFPDIQASIRSLFTPAGMVMTIFFVMIIAMVLSAAGGALASLFLRPRNPRL